MEQSRETPPENPFRQWKSCSREKGEMGSVVWEFRTLWRQINNMRTMCEKNLQSQDQNQDGTDRKTDCLSLEHFPWHLRAIWLISDSARLELACPGINLTLKMCDENAPD